MKTKAKWVNFKEIKVKRERDVDIQKRIAYITDSKNGEKRKLPLNNIAIIILENVRKHSIGSYIFANKDGKLFKKIYKGFKVALKRARITNFRFHDLRHTFVSHLVMNGTDPKTVQEFLGHKTFIMGLCHCSFIT